MTGGNLRLANSRKNNQDVHLFWQDKPGKCNHEYVGLVQVEEVLDEPQNDADGQLRKVFIFILKPID